LGALLAQQKWYPPVAMAMMEVAMAVEEIFLGVKLKKNLYICICFNHSIYK
jgi:hypothetical protein